MKKRSLPYLLLTLGLILFFISCKKSGGSSSTTGNNPLTGSWTLVSENWQSYSSQEFTDGADLQYINSSTLSTNNPSGLFTFSDSTVNIVNLGYAASASYRDFSYKNKAITDSAVGTTSFNFGDTSVSNSYTLVGTDSVLFPHGSYILLTRNAIGTSIAFQRGGTFTIDGNTLTLTSIVDTVGHNLIFSGIVEDTIRTNNRVVAVFQKQG